jgi:RHS repeat-associated protein
MGTVRYTTVNGEVLAEKRGGVRRQYVPDPLGSTVALLDNSQSKTDTFQYWPYGEESTRTGTTPTPLRFVGTLGYYRDNARRNYVRARHLDTRSGRWTTEDPVGIVWGDVGAFQWRHLYRYSRNQPTGFVDPLGLVELVENLKFGMLPTHMYIRFGSDQGCDGNYTYGFFPAQWADPNAMPGGLVVGDRIRLGPRAGNDNPSQDTGRNDPSRNRIPQILIKSIGDRQFAKALCDCIRNSKQNPPDYVKVTYMCTHWARDMWNCAIKKAGMRRPLVEPGTFPGRSPFA